MPYPATITQLSPKTQAFFARGTTLSPFSPGRRLPTAWTILQECVCLYLPLRPIPTLQTP